MLGRSVNLTTLFLGRLKPTKWLTVLSAHSFASNWQPPFLNQRKGENDHRKDFMINLNERMLPDRSLELTPSWSAVERVSDWAIWIKCLTLFLWRMRLYTNSWYLRYQKANDIQLDCLVYITLIRLCYEQF